MAGGVEWPRAEMAPFVKMFEFNGVVVVESGTERNGNLLCCIVGGVSALF